MNAELKKKWLEALRSGEIKQVQGYLKTDFGMCCLGVLCEVSGIGEWHMTGSLYAYMNATGYPPEQVSQLAGFHNNEEMFLAARNDDGWTFAEIADYIEANH